MKTDAFYNVLKDAKKICRDYSLCDSCLGRMFAKKLSISSNRLLGRKIHKEIGKSSKCYICRDLTENLDPIYDEILKKVSSYQFGSFLVGVMIKPSIIERDDLIRSKYKMMGTDSVKTDISGQLARRLSKKTGSVIEANGAELTITANLKDNSVELYSRSIIVVGRYTKGSRRLPQSRRSCRDCNGKGCTRCNFHGLEDFESVEGKIAGLLYERFSSSQVKITWLGGEAETSKVKGDGRIFFARILDPKKRNPRLAKNITLDGIGVSGLRQIASLPKDQPEFRTKIAMLMEADKGAELTITANLKDNSVELYSRSIIVVGRYTKGSRRLPQSRRSCRDCNGKGCTRCNFHGLEDFESVEGKIAGLLYERFSSSQVKITWLGGEAETSKVKGDGRIFFARILDPKKRNPRLAKNITLDGIGVSGLRQIASLPKDQPEFRTKIAMLMEADKEVLSEDLQRLKELKGSQMAIYKDSQRIEKSIRSIGYKKRGPRSFTLFLETDGSIPVKKFAGGETVFPNLSDYLNTKCTCKRYDILQITVQ